MVYPHPIMTLQWIIKGLHELVEKIQKKDLADLPHPFAGFHMSLVEPFVVQHQFLRVTTVIDVGVTAVFFHFQRWLKHLFLVLQSNIWNLLLQLQLEFYEVWFYFQTPSHSQEIAAVQLVLILGERLLIGKQSDFPLFVLFLDLPNLCFSCTIK